MLHDLWPSDNLGTKAMMFFFPAVPHVAMKMPVQLNRRSLTLRRFSEISADPGNRIGAFVLADETRTLP